MSKVLGIYVSTDNELDKLIKICGAAKEKGVEVKVFLTHIGTRLSKEPEFKDLMDLAEITLCKVGFDANKLEPVAGLPDRAYGSQSQHAEMLHECDRYITF